MAQVAFLLIVLTVLCAVCCVAAQKDPLARAIKDASAGEGKGAIPQAEAGGLQKTQSAARTQELETVSTPPNIIR